MGIGVPNVHEAWAWYRKHFGFDVPVFEEAATAGLMLKYTGGEPRDRHAILAMNMQGGGGFEIWQYTSRTPEGPKFDLRLGDLGIYACKLKCRDVHKAYADFDKQYVVSSKVHTAPDGKEHFFVKDLYGNLFQIIEEQNVFMETESNIGGVYGAIIGVSNFQKSQLYYGVMMDYHETLFEGVGQFTDFEGLPNGDGHFIRGIATHFDPRKGPFSELLGPSQIEIVQIDDQVETDVVARQIFEDRFWGDLGFIHLCFEMGNMDILKDDCARGGFPFTVDSADSFDMGAAAGRFSYIEDPDGALMEFVETHKIPILKKLGWYLNLRKRPPKEPLPRWMLKALALNRKKD